MVVLYAVLFIVGFLFLSQMSIIWKAKRKKGQRIEDIPGKIGEKIRRGEGVLLYFFSPSCRACKAQTPIFQRVKNQFRNAFAVDVSREQAIAQKFGVMGTPSIVWVKDGTIQQYWVGLRQEAQLLSLLREN